MDSKSRRASIEVHMDDVYKNSDDADIVLEENPLVLAGNNNIAGDISAFLVGDLRLTMWIPAESAGKVVGKKGVIISNIKLETKAKLLESRLAVGDSLWSPVIIHGESDCVKAAHDAVSKIVGGEVDDVVAEFAFNKKKHSALLGRSGFEFIKRISAETNVRILIPDVDHKSFKNRDRENYTPSYFSSLEGQCDNVFRALAFLSSEALKSMPTILPFDEQPTIKADIPVFSKNVQTAAANVSPPPALLETTSAIVTVNTVNDIPKKFDQIRTDSPTTFLQDNPMRAVRSSPKKLTQQISDVKVISSEKIKEEVPELIPVVIKSISQPSTDSQVVVEELPASHIDLMNIVKEDITPAISQDDTESAIQSSTTPPENIVEPKTIFIPANIVGLLLHTRESRDFRDRERPLPHYVKPFYNSSVMNSIQKKTLTRISRTKPAPPSKRKAVNKVSSENTVESSNIVVKTSDSEEVLESATILQVEGGDVAKVSQNEEVNTVAKEELEDVEFLVTGRSEQGMADAIAYINRIIGGERINDVLVELNQPKYYGHQPYPRSNPPYPRKYGDHHHHDTNGPSPRQPRGKYPPRHENKINMPTGEVKVECAKPEVIVVPPLPAADVDAGNNGVEPKVVVTTEGDAPPAKHFIKKFNKKLRGGDDAKRSATGPPSKPRHPYSKQRENKSNTSSIVAQNQTESQT